MSDFDFSCSLPVRILDMNKQVIGKLNDAFVAYDRTQNLKVLHAAFSGTDFLKYVPNEVIEFRARYPDSATCEE
jgi:hypothetical protein